MTVRHRRFDPAFVDAGRETRWPDKALHSLLPPAALLATAAARRSRNLAVFAAAWAVHNGVDIGMHDGSARAPAWPLSGWRFRSRLATDEPGHHASWVLAGEALLCLASVLPAQHVKVPRASRPQPGRQAGYRAMMGAFLRDWHHVGTLWTTGPGPASAMLDLAGGELAAAVRVEEIGAGTGAITRLILARVSPAAVVDAYERDKELNAMVSRELLPSDQLRLHFDAEGMDKVLDGERADVMVSAYPWTSVRPDERERMMRLICRCLQPDGVVLAIQYSRHSEALFRRYFGQVTAHRYGRLRWPVLYRLASPRVNPDAA